MKLIKALVPPFQEARPMESRLLRGCKSMEPWYIERKPLLKMKYYAKTNPYPNVTKCFASSEDQELNTVIYITAKTSTPVWP